MMKCIFCQAEMERGVAPFHIDRKGYHLILDAIPAWVCSQCGEIYFEESEVEAIQQVIRVLDKHTEKLALSA
jgi:YgiT-type zinc finger domain-containing protein